MPLWFYGFFDCLEVEDQDNITRKIRWKLALGQPDEQVSGQLSLKEKKVDKALEKLYPSDRTGGLSGRRNISAKWMGEIKSLFPSPVIRILQRDALEKFGIKKLLSQPSFLDEIEPDVGMIATILSAKGSLSATALHSARTLVSRLARQVEQKLKFQLISRLSGARNNRLKINNPHHREINWHLTIKSNLKNYQPSLRTIIPERIVGHPRNRNRSRRIVILVDQSASMAESFVYAGILGSIMASIPTLKTHLIVFDTEVIDLSDYLTDPVELLFKGQLGGGTNIQKALHYAADLCVQDSDPSFIVLISDLFEGAPVELLYDVVQTILNHEIGIISLLALDDYGSPSYDKAIARNLCAMGITAFGCSPELFSEVIAAALNEEDLSRYAK